MRAFLTLFAVGLIWANQALPEEPLVVRCTPTGAGTTLDTWSAQWIWGPVEPNGARGFFRKEFTVRPGLRAATAQMSGDDGYALLVNGEAARQGGFWWKQTDREDITSLLHPGRNVLAAELINAADPGGWLLEVALLYDDGSEEIIATDKTWHFAAEAPEGWAKPGFDDTAWMPCAELGSPPDTAPWGFLPHEKPGDDGRVALVSAEVPGRIHAGDPAQGHVELRPRTPLGSRARLLLELRRGKDELLNQAWTLSPAPSEWPVGRLVRIELPAAISRFLTSGEVQLAYRLAGMAVDDEGSDELTRKKVNVVNEAKPSITTATVKEHGGAPTLFINDEPTFPMWFWQREVVAEDAKAFRDAGVDVFTFCSPGYYLTPGWVGDGVYDYAEFDGIMLRLLAKDPEAYAVPRIFVGAPEWWVDKYPEEACRYANGAEWQSNGWGGTKHESFASRQWLNDGGEALRRFVRHVTAAPYSDRVIGIHVANGIYGEWHTWSATDIPDTSEPMRRAFVDYAKDQYDNNEAALRQAWGDSSVNFEDTAIPGIGDRHQGDDGMFRDPSKSRWVADYYACLHRVTVNAIDHFCRIVKEESDGRLFTCVFYGYAPDLNWPQEGDHRATAMAHRLDSIDVFSSPHAYERRALGEDGLFRNYPAALALHGKLFVDEADDRTSLANDPQFTHVETIEQSIEVVRREFGNAVTHGTGLWYMDQQDTWFHDDRIMVEIGNLKRWGDISMSMPRESVAEVAVISTLDSEFHLAGRDSGLNQVTYPLYDAQIGEFCKSGAPFDWFLMEDLVEGRIPPHKVYIFLDAFYMTPERKAAVDTLKADDRTLIWFYAPGYVTPEGLSLETMAEVTGIDFTRAENGLPQVRLERSVLGAAPFSYGPTKEQTPLFLPSDDDAAVWGRYTDTKKPGLVVKNLGAWKSVYSGAPELPAVALRKLLADAGVHLYGPAGDVLTANASWVMLHTASAGTKTVRLPRTASVYDVIHNKSVGEGIDEFSVELPAGTTAIFALDPPASYVPCSR